MKARTATVRALVRISCFFLILAGASGAVAQEVGPGVVITPNGMLPMRDAAPGKFFGSKGEQTGTVDSEKQYVVIAKEVTSLYFKKQIWLQVVPREEFGNLNTGQVNGGWVYAGDADKIQNVKILGAER